METGFLVVHTDGRTVGLAVNDVVSVERMVAVTPLVDAPAWIDGVIDVRGELVPVVCLATRLGAHGSAPGVDDHLVIARAGGTTVALRVSEATGVTASLSDDDIVLIEDGHALDRLAHTTDGILLVPDLAKLLDGLDLPAMAGASDRP